VFILENVISDLPLPNKQQTISYTLSAYQG